MNEKRVDREATRHSIAEEAAHWDVTDTSQAIEQESEWFTFEWTQRQDRCDRCGGGMDGRRIDLHLAGGRVTLHNVAWYVCRTPRCGQTRLSPIIEQVAREIEASVERATALAEHPSGPSSAAVEEQESIPV